MALPMVHLETAYLAAQALKPSDMSAYLLGAIAPDGMHMRSPYSGEMKSASHYGLHGKTDLSDDEVARKLLEHARGEELDVLPAVEAEAWRDRTLPWYEQHRERIDALDEPHSLTKDEITEFCKMASERCAELFSR